MQDCQNLATFRGVVQCYRRWKRTWPSEKGISHEVAINKLCSIGRVPDTKGKMRSGLADCRSLSHRWRTRLDISYDFLIFFQYLNGHRRIQYGPRKCRDTLCR